MVEKKIEEIVNRYGKQMLFVAEGILRNRQDAEDAVQTALLRISSQCRKLPAEDRVLRVYVLTAAKNAALDLLPKRWKAVDIEQLPLSDPHDLFEDLVRSEEYHRLLAAIETLPVQYKEVLLLRYVQELDVKDIAKLLNRSKATVHKQITRAKRLLVKSYEKEEKT